MSCGTSTAKVMTCVQIGKIIYRPKFFVLEDGLLRSNSATSKITADVNSPHCSVDTPPFVPASSKQMPQGLFGSAISIREGCLVQQSAEAAFESGSQQALWCDNQPRLRLSQVSNKLWARALKQPRQPRKYYMLTAAVCDVDRAIDSVTRIVSAASFPASCQS